MSVYHYTLRGYSPQGSISRSGTVAAGKEVTLEELVREIERATGETLDPNLSGAVLMVEGKRVDWDTDRGLILPSGAKIAWIAPAMGG